jgi:hypothetical protein
MAKQKSSNPWSAASAAFARAADLMHNLADRTPHGLETLNDLSQATVLIQSANLLLRRAAAREASRQPSPDGQ